MNMLLARFPFLAIVCLCLCSTLSFSAPVAITATPAISDGKGLIQKKFTLKEISGTEGFLLTGANATRARGSLFLSL